MVDLLEVVAEPQRRKLVQLLSHGERTVTELTSEFSVTRSAISQQMRLLEKVGMVTARKDGRNRFYRLEEKGINNLQKIFDSFWSYEFDLLVKEAHALHSRIQRGET
jgi:DNA-binding transcriptional ArsR family regulator